MTEILMNKTRVKKRFKRYGQHRAGTGHDTAHRDMEISDEQMTIRWCYAWHFCRPAHWDFAMQVCKTCGTTYEAIYPLLPHGRQPETDSV
jgi:hypothetical protein